MKQRCLILTAALLIGVLYPGSPGAETLKIAYPNFPPFHSRNESGAMEGFFYEILANALEERLNLKLQWDTFPWTRCQHYVETGRYDAIITVPTQDRLQYCVTHPTPFFEKQMVVFTYSGHPKLPEIQSIKTLDDVKAGGFSVITYIGNGWNQNNVAARGIQVIESPNLEGVWKMLAGRRGDLVIEWPAGAYPDMKRLSLEAGIVETDIVLAAMPFHLLIGRQSRFSDWTDRIEATFHSMRQDGSLDAILRDWGL